MATGPNIQSEALFSGVSATGAQSAVLGRVGHKTYQASGATSSGSGSATVVIQGSNNGDNWDTIGTITLTLSTTSSSDSFTSSDAYSKVRGNVTAISGTGASVSATQAFWGA